VGIVADPLVYLNNPSQFAIATQRRPCNCRSAVDLGTVADPHDLTGLDVAGDVESHWSGVVELRESYSIQDRCQGLKP
jgi:hypothetical protein